MAALGTFIAGAFTGTYGAVATGMTRTGHEIEMSLKQETINETDLYALTTIDAILRGGDCFYQAEFREYKVGSLSCFTTPFTTVVGGVLTAAMPIDRLASGVAVAMVLTSIANTPAAAAPATLTASLALLVPDYPVKLLYDSRLRPVNIRMQFYPSLASTTLSWFTQT